MRKHSIPSLAGKPTLTTTDPFVQEALRKNHFEKQYKARTTFLKNKARADRRGPLSQADLDKLRKTLSKKNPFKKAAN